jgi:hypothetical protein
VFGAELSVPSTRAEVVGAQKFPSPHCKFIFPIPREDINMQSVWMFANTTIQQWNPCIFDLQMKSIPKILMAINEKNGWTDMLGSVDFMYWTCKITWPILW